MATPTWWTWVWVSSGSWWWTGKCGVLQSMGSQRFGHDWATELNREIPVISILLFFKVVFESENKCRSVISDSFWPHGLYSPWNSLGQNTGVGSPSLLQGLFPTQGLNPGLLHCRQILYQLSHQGSPKGVLAWAYRRGGVCLFAPSKWTVFTSGSCIFLLFNG